MKMLLLATYQRKYIVFKDVLPGHNIAYENIDNFFKKIKVYFMIYFVVWENDVHVECLRFHWCVLKGFNFIRPVLYMSDIHNCCNISRYQKTKIWSRNFHVASVYCKYISFH